MQKHLPILSTGDLLIEQHRDRLFRYAQSN
jgi:hypothetical protein